MISSEICRRRTATMSRASQVSGGRSAAKAKHVGLSLLALLLLSGCSSERSRLMKEQYPSYPESVKHAIERGYLLRGMTHEQVFLTLGEPICKRTIRRDDRDLEVWLYPPGGRAPCTTAQHRIYFDKGVVDSWKFMEPAPGGG